MNINIEKDKEYFKFVKDKFKELLYSVAIDAGYFISITPVGSHVDDKDVEKVNDLDVVMVFDKLTPDKWDNTIKLFDDFASTYSTDSLGVLIETRFGPFKTKSDKPITMQLHLLFFDLESFAEYTKTSPLISFDWFRFSPIYGENLEKISPLPFITKETIIKNRGGIDYSLEQIAGGLNITLCLSFDDEEKLIKKLEKISQTKEQKAETYFKSIKNILLAMWKIKEQVNEKPSDEQLERFASEVFLAEDLFLIKNLENVYKKARNGEEISTDELEVSKKNSVDILLKLKNRLLV